jgi:hypothetical protein
MDAVGRNELLGSGLSEPKLVVVDLDSRGDPFDGIDKLLFVFDF